MVGSSLLRAAAKVWFVKTLDLRRSVPVPRDSHDVTSGAADPDRVLLIGNGPTHGWGTVTHDLALTGQLSRTLTRATGRPTDVRYVGDEMMNVASVLPWLRDTRLSDYDLVLLVLSLSDAVRLTPVSQYRAQMAALLERVDSETKSTARVVVAGIRDVLGSPHYAGVLGRLGQRSADRLNVVVRSLVGRFDGMEYMDLVAPEPEPGRPHGSPGMYAAWSQAFVESCVPALAETRAMETVRAEVDAIVPTWEWAPARHIVDEAPKAGWDGLNTIVSAAQAQFGTDIAYISVIDGGQQYFAASTIPNGRSVPLELSHCSVTVQGLEPVIVRNALTDARFPNSDYLDTTQMRFYAGVPLQNEEGRTVGTFCVASAIPVANRRVTEDRLLEYAARAQQELQRIASGRIPVADRARR